MASRNAVRNVRGERAKEFVRALEGLASRRSKWEVFTDWALFAADALYNQFHQDPEVEEEYLARAKRYDSAEMRTMSELLGLVTIGLEEEGGDFLGQVYEGAGIANEQHGQFFTPYPISRFMAELQIVGGLPTGRIVTISDPCCGAGGMAVAMCEALRERGFNYQQWAYIEAQDIDPTCFRMAYVQLSLIGAPALVILGDTLSMERLRAWTTPMFEMVLMGPRLAAQIAREEEPIQIPLPTAEQLDLFGKEEA